MSRENIGSYELKTKLPEILRRVQAGESFTITNRGKPVADLMPSKAASKQKTAAAIAAIRKISRTVASISDERLEEYRKEDRK
ncbi:MAG: type II toxin-antitoxin system prevent-host-death family antitoxin [Candidatus Dadabacteria bacterium]|nr:type II toxin-antitoxin system prevent-host-death family antitoxin [Candidatus Dadabacteria bacterium]MYA48799.1 type II toxin-antitoxin system prevent-host-death family antitoxin [Candidatus Dadabacteria bacterium]MYG82346.1 type II toxin-antitoxin system prevent-host-death family antitoxin [Candidatus Dadabacteria bacterium]MYK49866.1 type II toxin-antitoxin system prevent-host-death family antitoxin [Candidatus Dadabacteria bacterium]